MGPLASDYRSHITGFCIERVRPELGMTFFESSRRFGTREFLRKFAAAVLKVVALDFGTVVAKEESEQEG